MTVFLAIFRKKEDSILPKTWPKTFEEGHLIDMAPDKSNELANKFTQSMSVKFKSVRVVNVQEVCNEEFYGKYARYSSIGNNKQT